MAVGFDTVETLDELWALHKEDKLNSLIQSILITSGDLEAASLKDVTLKTKVWDDEYDVCKEELEMCTKPKLDIQFMRKSFSTNRPSQLNHWIIKSSFSFYSLLSQLHKNPNDVLIRTVCYPCVASE